MPLPYGGISATGSDPGAEIVGDTFVLDVRVELANDGVNVGVSFSTDLATWTEAPATALISCTNHGGGIATLIFLAPSP